jgi:LysM repeat protein
MLLDPRQRSTDPAVCPFLRSVDPSGTFAAPIDAVDPANVCLASVSSETPPPAQQETRCLVAAHVSCVRYLTGSPAMPGARPRASSGLPADAAFVGDVAHADGAAVGRAVESAPGSIDSAAPAAAGLASAALSSDPSGGLRDASPSAEPARPAPPRRPTLLTGPIIVAVLFLLGSTATAIGFAAARGGIQLPIASPSAAAVASTAPSDGANPTSAPSAGQSAAPTASAAATPGATPAPSAAPTPAATSDRYAVLEACPDTPDCYIYTIRQGDNLRSIANYFGVPYQTVLDLNPWIVDPSTVHRGEKLTLPPPTR